MMVNNTRYKPYSLVGEPNASMVEQIDAMFSQLYQDVEINEVRDLLAATLSDVTAGSPSEGSLIVGSDDLTSRWEVLEAGESGSVLGVNADGSLEWAEHLFIDYTNDRFGINTDSPTLPLHVVGPSFVQANFISSADVGGGVRLKPSAANPWSLIATGATAAQGTNKLLFFYNDATDIAVLTSTGRLGLGTNVPNAVLDVRGDAIFNEDSADFDFRVESNGNANMLFVDGGTDRIGIGTGTPTTGIHGASSGFIDINSASIPGVLLHRNSTAQECSFASDGTGMYLDVAGHATASNNAIIFRTEETNSQFTPTERMRITSAGLVNIVTDSGLGIVDTDASHYMRLDCGSNLTADRTLSIVPGDAARTITINGNPTLNDWFDQSVKTTATVAFGGLTVDTDVLHVDATNNRVYIGTTTATSARLYIESTNGEPTLLMEVDSVGRGMRCQTQDFNSGTSTGTIFLCELNSGSGNTFGNFRVNTAGGSAGGNLVISTAGHVGIATSGSFPASGPNTLGIGQSSGDPGTIPSNTAGIYTKDVAGTCELYTYDEAGNFTLQSPHGFELFAPDPDEPAPWCYNSSNPYTGEQVNIDMAKLVRLVEVLTGETLIYRRSTTPTCDWADDQEKKVQGMKGLYEEWERRHAEKPDPTRLKPPMPLVKNPPAWLASRLTKVGMLNTAKLDTLRADVEQWKQRDPSRSATTDTR